ncbi:serpentine type 7TM GPCR chemoreceptor srt domain-containing protein [Ditylenchus destructor]|nr:serpentine type 7TM GPCR chemoreceptor srt domain-containing protein [Ditylenchus destructor]
MNYYWFDHATFDRLYNCSMHTQLEWESKRDPNRLGSMHLILATIYQTLYLMFLCIMLQHRFWKHSCYKLLFLLGVIDFCATVVGGTFYGIFSSHGEIFCTNQKFIYLSGCFQAAFWSAACITALILLINRAIDLVDQKHANFLFADARTYIWFFLPISSFLYMWFYTKPFLFNSITGVSSLNPFIGTTDIKVDTVQYRNVFFDVQNCVIPAVYLYMYLVICVIIVKKTKDGAISAKQKQVMRQSIAMSALFAFTAVTYLVTKYIHTPPIMTVVVQFMWQASHGASVFTYIFVNKSTRRQAVRILRLCLSKCCFICIKCNSKTDNRVSNEIVESTHTALSDVFC